MNRKTRLVIPPFTSGKGQGRDTGDKDERARTSGRKMLELLYVEGGACEVGK